MKQTYLLIIALFLSLSIYPQLLKENKTVGEVFSIQNIMMQAGQAVLKTENELAQEVVHLQIDLLTDYEYKWTYRDLYPGWDYIIFAEGETSSIKDLDMILLVQNPSSQKWVQVERDNRVGTSCMMIVSPKVESLKYAIGVKAVSFKEDHTGHYYIIISHPLIMNKSE